ncbi:MAG: DNA repair exonuclease [Candidatus Eremiobacteraeota bacterium]|nr:DNA repair exonuclease [Candidatus Eremiobacteraeota bacterium]
MPLTLVHCADVHLETTFPDTRGGAARRKALADAFVRIVDEAIRREADVLTIGGDLYEAERAGPQTFRFLAEQFARFGKPVFVAPGNHDPHAPSALLARGDLPDNVRVFNEANWRAYPLASDVTLWGFGHTAAEPGRPFAGVRFDRGGVQLALVHGSDEARCPPHKRATAPFTSTEILASGASLALSGHYHGGYVVSQEGRPVFAYPGSPEPIKFGEGPGHGALCVTVRGSAIDVRPLPTAKTRVVEIACDLSGTGHENAAFERIWPTLAGLGRDDYVRLKLTGAISAGTRIDRALVEERLGSGLGSLEVVDATRRFDYERIAEEPTVRGHVVRDLLSLARDGERAAEAQEALRYAVAAFEGAEILP